MELIVIACDLRNEEFEKELKEIVLAYGGNTDWHQTSIRPDDIELAAQYRMARLAKAVGKYMFCLDMPEPKPEDQV